MQVLRGEYSDLRTRSFEDYRRMVNANALRLGILLTAAVQVPFVLFEWLALREQFLWVQLLRALWLIPPVSLYPQLKAPSNALLRHVDGITWLIYVAAAAYVVVVAFLHAGYESPYIHGLILMFVGVCSVTLWHLWFALTFAAAVYGAYWLPMLLGYGSIGNLTNWIGYQCFLIGTMGIVLVSQHLRLQMADADFQRRSELEKEKAQTQILLERVAVLRQQRLAWLESLAKFLRHELKNQIVAVGTSIDLAQSGESLEANWIYLDRARRSLNRMRGLVTSATEATSLEAALAVEEMERVDLSGVVMDRLTIYQELHPSRRFTLNLRPGLSVDGNEGRVAQLLDKLLSNAVEHSPEGAEIRVGLEPVDADWIQLSVENEGDALPEDKARIFEAFVSTQKTKDNLGLGLFVAQSITLNHGGQISAEELPRGSGARFVVRLPTARRGGASAKEAESRPVHGEEARLVGDQPPQ